MTQNSIQCLAQSDCVHAQQCNADILSGSGEIIHLKNSIVTSIIFLYAAGCSYLVTALSVVAS